MIQKFILYLILFCSWNTFATTFVPVSLDTQLRDSTGVLHGRFAGEGYRRLPNDEIITEASFQIIGTAGINGNDLINPNEMKVIYPGGRWEDREEHVMGAPVFEKGEEVILLLNKNSFGFWLHNLSLGKYNVVHSNGLSEVVNSVFPYHAQYGRMVFKKFEEKVREHMKTPLVPVRNDREVVIESPDNANPKQTRAIASIKEKTHENEMQADANFHILWVAMVIGLLGLAMAITRIFRKEK